MKLGTQSGSLQEGGWGMGVRRKVLFKAETIHF